MGFVEEEGADGSGSGSGEGAEPYHDGMEGFMRHEI
jgi:hypothetical protein